MGTKEDIRIRPAIRGDIDELLRLYFIVYGNSYPLPLGTDRQVMADMIDSEDCHRVVAECPQAGIIVGSVLVETDPNEKIGKLAGLVVHPDHRRRDIALVMTKHLQAGWIT